MLIAYLDLTTLLKSESHCYIDISAEDERTSYKIRQFTKGTEYFKDRLGLTFKKVDGMDKTRSKQDR